MSRKSKWMLIVTLMFFTVARYHLPVSAWWVLSLVFFAGLLASCAAEAKRLTLARFVVGAALSLAIGLIWRST